MWSLILASRFLALAKGALEVCLVNVYEEQFHAAPNPFPVRMISAIESLSPFISEMALFLDWILWMQYRLLFRHTPVAACVEIREVWHGIQKRDDFLFQANELEWIDDREIRFGKFPLHAQESPRVIHGSPYVKARRIDLGHIAIKLRERIDRLDRRTHRTFHREYGIVPGLDKLS
jgi:uncharacterized membrane protein YqjE